MDSFLIHSSSFSCSKMLATVIGSLTLLSGGIAVLHRIACKTDVLYGEKIQPFMSRRWEQVKVCDKLGESIQLIQEPDMYMDVSLLDEQGSGIAPVYTYPSIGDRFSVCVVSYFLLPIVVMVRMLYNIFRFFVIPFYIIFQMVCQFYQEGIPSEERFICSDIIREMARSLLQTIKAPFYGVACYLAGLYGLLNPLSGRVVMASIERDWNNDVIRSRSVWGIFCEQNYMWEGGGTRSGLGQHAWYLLGCFQPARLFLLKNGKIISGAKPSIQAFPESKEYLGSFLYGVAEGRLPS